MKLKKLLAISIAAATSIYAAGYKIPEQSLNGTALAAAYVANANGADASYYNPANMVFSSKGNQLEIALSYVSASAIDFDSDGTSSLGAAGQGSSEKETVFIPTMHYILPQYFENTMFGVSLVVPAGLSKRWEGDFAKKSAENFTLEIIELNPTIAYKINEQFSIGGGLRLIKSEGIVKSHVLVGTTEISRDLEASSIDWGYNLAMTYKPTTETTLAITYRSYVDIEVNGTGELKFAAGHTYDGDASVSFPLPAALNLALSHDFGNLTAEVVYERTYWSKYNDLDFNYEYDLNTTNYGAPVGSFHGAFDEPRAKNWKDTNTYRLGLTYQANNDLKLMAGFAIDETPVPDETIGFELPDADAKIYSTGFEYKLNETSSIGAAYLLSVKDDRKAMVDGVEGTFRNSSVSLFTIGYSHSF